MSPPRTQGGLQMGVVLAFWGREGEKVVDFLAGFVEEI